MSRTSQHQRREVSRIEGFSDAVFAFAVTLLVVSLEVPHTFDELWADLRTLLRRGPLIVVFFRGCTPFQHS